MATYVIGDVQGCMRSLEALLELLAFQPATDRLWFAGDLVNRGPLSVEVLRFCVRHDESVRSVLGNHDIHLLARGMGVADAKAKDTVEDVLGAPDALELLEWLLHRPLVHREHGVLLLHAGVHPAWTLQEVLSRADAATSRLRGPDGRALLAAVAVRDATLEDPSLHRDVETIRVLCNLRCCDAEGHPQLGFTGHPDEAPAGSIPWYAHPERERLGEPVFCGHWAAQGFLRNAVMTSLDTGCVWGGQLTALRLEDGKPFSVDCVDAVEASLRNRWR